MDVLSVGPQCNTASINSVSPVFLHREKPKTHRGVCSVVNMKKSCFLRRRSIFFIKSQSSNSMDSPEHDIVPCGFLVVRLPQFNIDAFESDGNPRHIGQILYHGVDRMPWFDLDQDYVSNKLPEHLFQARKAIRRECRDFTGLPLSCDVVQAREILAYSNRERIQNELIIIGSKLLSEIKGRVVHCSQPVTRLGFDVVSLGNWSLIGSGAFVRPESFPKTVNNLSAYGLLASPDVSKEVQFEYSEAVNRGFIEDLPESPDGIDVLYVGRLEP